MKRLMCFVLSMVMLGACSGDQDSGEEEGHIEQMTEKAGRQLAGAVQEPLDRARSVKTAEDLQAERLRQLGGEDSAQ